MATTKLRKSTLRAVEKLAERQAPDEPAPIPFQAGKSYPNLIAMDVHPAIRARLRAMMQFSGHTTEPAMISVCIAFTHSLMQLCEGHDMVVTADQLKFALANSELIAAEPVAESSN
jgi:hypothetical protein